MKTVVIVGAGPAGLAAALKLSENPNLSIILLEQGRSIEHRRCPSIESGQCANCKPCNIGCGVGGAGLFSDGKLLFSDQTGTNLPELIGIDKTQKLIQNVKDIFWGLGVLPSKVLHEEEGLLSTRASQLGLYYISTLQAHIGSDKLPGIISNLIKSLSQKVRIVTNVRVESIHPRFLITSDGKEYSFDYLLVGPGRAGASWLEKIIVESKSTWPIEYDYNPIDIGVRVEVPAAVLDEVCSISWDFKVKIRLSNDDEIRTFCVCPNGWVTREDYGNYSLVNGYAKKDEKSNNSNFAFLVKYKLTAPVKNSNTWGQKVAEQVTFAGGGKPLVQRLADLRQNRRSTPSRISDSYLTPSLKDATPGDIGMAMGYRFVSDILEGLERLDKLVPGIAQNSTLLYAPEIKFHGLKIKTDKNLQSLSVPGIYFIGDCSGYSRGIVGAMTTGLLAAEGVLSEN